MSPRCWITLVFAITGCIRDQLVPCGPLDCPRGSTCIADQLCATPDQIDACTGLADAAPCDSSMGLGYCELGACVPNTCGDGMLTGNEVCDGSLTTVTCGDLGYYRGATSCSGGCALDRTGCEGRCGDEIIDRDAREECDTAPPVSTCTSFGRDYGSLGCSRFCTPAITSDCFYYGWHQVMPNGTPISAAAVNDHGAIAVVETGVRVIWDGVETFVAEREVSHALASPDRLVAVGSQKMVIADATGVRTLATGILGSPTLDRDALFAITNDCALQYLDLASQTPSARTVTRLTVGPTQCLAIARGGLGRLYVPARADGLWAATVDPTASTVQWERVSTRNSARLDPTAFGRFVVTAGDAYEIDTTVSPVTERRVVGGGGDERAFDDDLNAIVLTFDKETRAPFAQYYFGGYEVDTLPAPPTGILHVGQSASREVFVAGRGISLLRPTRGVPLVNDDYQAFVRLSATEAAYCTFNAATAPPAQPTSTVGVLGSPTGYYTTPWNLSAHGQCQDIIGDPRGEHFVASSQGVFSYKPATGYAREIAGHTSDLGRIDEELFAFSGSVVSRRSAQGVWSPLPMPSCAETKLFASGGNRVFLTCGASLYEWRANAWVPLGAYPSAVSQLEVGATGLPVARTSTQIVFFDGTQFSALDDSGLFSIDGDDLWIASETDGTITHVEPNRTTTFTAPRARAFIVLATHIYIATLVPGVSTIIPRRPSVTAGTGL